MRAARQAVLLPALVLTGAWNVAAQAGPELALTTGVDPDTVTVGERFRVGIRVSAPPGVTVRFPSFEDATGTLQLYEPARTVEDPTDMAVRVHVYPLVAWRTELQRPVVPLELVLPDGSARAVRMELPLPHVRSVLPADTAGLNARGHRGIIEAGLRFPLWPVLLLLLALVLLALALLLLLRRRRATPTPATGEDPREWALTELDAVRRSLWLPADQRPFFSGVSGVLRGYVAALSPQCGRDLTTRELLRYMTADRFEPGATDELARILGAADQVKFARVRLSEAEAEAVWRSARSWVDAAPRPGASPATEPGRRAA